MSDSECSKQSDNSESVENTEYNEELDFFSDKFNPLLALRVFTLKVPDEEAKVYDNLASYKTAIEDQKNPRPKKEKKAIPATEIIRRWLPEQMPVPSTKFRKVQNILTRMKEIQGPLASLWKCVEQRLKIKIYTRDDRGVRGYVIGYLAAFDKHWNVALEEVYEVWTRRKKRKVHILERIAERRPPMILRPPKIIVRPHETDKKLEICSRNINQLMMRGEHIVNVIVDYQEAPER